MWELNLVVSGRIVSAVSLRGCALLVCRFLLQCCCAQNTMRGTGIISSSSTLRLRRQWVSFLGTRKLCLGATTPCDSAVQCGKQPSSGWQFHLLVVGSCGFWCCWAVCSWQLFCKAPLVSNPHSIMISPHFGVNRGESQSVQPRRAYAFKWECVQPECAVCRCCCVTGLAALVIQSVQRAATLVQSHSMKVSSPVSRYTGWCC